MRTMFLAMVAALAVALSTADTAQAQRMRTRVMAGPVYVDSGYYYPSYSSGYYYPSYSSYYYPSYDYSSYYYPGYYSSGYYSNGYYDSGSSYPYYNGYYQGWYPGSSFIDRYAPRASGAMRRWVW